MILLKNCTNLTTSDYEFDIFKLLSLGVKQQLFTISVKKRNDKSDGQLSPFNVSCFNLVSH